MWKEELLKLCHDCWNNIEFRVFCEPNPPKKLRFPDELACSADIKYFYEICNGGYNCTDDFVKPVILAGHKMVILGLL
jgi:hypothetical protein